MKCRKCIFWGRDNEFGIGEKKQCCADSELFEITGGDMSDNLYTSPEFGCVVYSRGTRPAALLGEQGD
jgi:hypothetical protein